MASFLRRYGQQVDAVVFSLFRNAPDEWLKKHAQRIAVINLSLTRPEGKHSSWYKWLTPSSYGIYDLNTTLNMERYGCGDIQYNLAIEEYNPLLPMVHIGLRINQVGVNGESMVFHECRIIKRQNHADWVGLDLTWKQLVDAVALGTID